MLPGFEYAAFNDVAAATAAIDDQTAGVIVEPVQGEGGINVATVEFLRGLRSICSERGALLIADEVQTGMGRTGEWFAYKHYGVEPDILTCAKALAGGVAAGVMLARRDVASTFKPGMHASTFGGNPIACRAGLATIETIEEDGLLERGKAIGDRFRRRFEAIQAKNPALVREIRVLGAMIGVELSIDAAAVVDACLGAGGC